MPKHCILAKKRSSEAAKNIKPNSCANCSNQLSEEPQLNTILKKVYSFCTTVKALAAPLTEQLKPKLLLFSCFHCHHLDTNDSMILHLATTLSSSLLFPPQVLFYYLFFYLVPFSFQSCTIKTPPFYYSPQMLKIIFILLALGFLPFDPFSAFLVSHLTLSYFPHLLFPHSPPTFSAAFIFTFVLWVPSFSSLQLRNVHLFLEPDNAYKSNTSSLILLSDFRHGFYLNWAFHFTVYSHSTIRARVTW